MTAEGNHGPEHRAEPATVDHRWCQDAGTDGKDMGADIDSMTQTTEMHKWRIVIATA